MEQAEGGRDRPRTALLTIGSGRLAMQVWNSLEQHSDLRAVVFSKRKKSGTAWQKLSQFGAWYTAQHLYGRIRNLLAGYRIRPERTEAACAYWETAEDAGRISALLESQAVELVVVCGFHFRLTDGFRSCFTECVNVHPSLLPAYRGPEPLVWALLEKVPVVGLSLHCIDAGFDTGDVLLQESVERGGTATIFGLENRLAECAQRMVPRLCKLFCRQELRRIPQSAGAYYPLPSLKARKKLGL